MRYLLLLVTATGLLAASEMKMTLEQLKAFIQSAVSLKQPDVQVAKYLHQVKLTEKLDDRTVETLQGMGAGPKTVGVLREMVDATASMPVAAPPPPKNYVISGLVITFPTMPHWWSSAPSNTKTCRSWRPVISVGCLAKPIRREFQSMSQSRPKLAPSRSKKTMLPLRWSAWFGARSRRKIPIFSRWTCLVLFLAQATAAGSIDLS